MYKCQFEAKGGHCHRKYDICVRQLTDPILAGKNPNQKIGQSKSCLSLNVLKN